MTSDAHQTGLAAIGRLDVAAAFSTQQASSRHDMHCPPWNPTSKSR